MRLLLILGFSVAAHAQFDTAAVLGTVRDPSGALIPGVAVTLRNTETGIAATARTDAKGDYQFPTVRIGAYEVTAEHPGFAAAVVRGIVVTVNARQRVDVTLQVGAVSDKVVVTGPIGDHGAVIAAHRSNLEVGTALVSDCGSVARLIDAVYAAGVRPKFMRDPTRGGLATVLAELAKDAEVTVELFEQDLPVRDAVAGICDILGLDPLYLPCEGRAVLIVPAGQANQTVRALNPLAEGAAVVGQISDRSASPVVLMTRYGGGRAYDTLASEQLPRIC